MKTLSKILLFTSLTISTMQANAGSVIMEIKSIFVNKDNRTAHVCVNRIPAETGTVCEASDVLYCSESGGTERITLDLNSESSKEIYSMLLTAHATGKKVHFFLSNTNPCEIDTVNML